MATKPPFIDGISTKGVHIIKLKNGTYRHFIRKKPRGARLYTTFNVYYANLKEASAASIHWNLTGEIIPPVEPLVPPINSPWDY